MKRKILSILLTLCLLVNLVPYVTPTASAYSYSGECGDNLTWTLDMETGVLRISGTGDMTDSPWSSYSSSIQSVEIESGVTSIADLAFYDYTGLTSVTIPDSVTSIGGSAFYGCTSLTSVNIPDSVTSIGISAFNDTEFYNNEANWAQDGLYIGKHLIQARTESDESYTIREGTLTIGGNAFYNFRNLTSMTIPDGVTSIGNSAFNYCTNLTSITIPDSVTYIGDNAFGQCYGLTSVTIPDGVTSIGNRTFNDCTNLTSITIPDSVTYIGDSAFNGCTNLTSITIPDSVTSIGGWAFHDCIRLTSVNIPENVSCIGDAAFAGCTARIFVDAANLHYTSDTYGILYNKDGTTLINYPKAYTGDYSIPNHVVTIGGFAFYSSNLTSVTIGNGVTSIGECAFAYCKSLTSVTIPDSVTSIGREAFWWSYDLSSIIIPDSTIFIGEQAFSQTAYYNDKTNWEQGILYIGNHLIVADKNISGSCIIRDGTITIAEGAFNNYTNPISVTIPDSVISIGECAFAYCSGLTSVTIGNGVTSIGERAFNGCSSLTSVTIGNGVTSIGDYAFHGCNSLNSVAIPDSAISIGDSAFGYCRGLTSVTIGNGVTSIGERAFEYCSGLTSVTIPDSAISIGDNAFEYCSSLTSVTIGNGVTSIGERAFAYCESLTSVTIPDSVTTIGEWAFLGCASLISATIGNGVTSIGDYAFRYCRGLTSATIGSSVTSIGRETFYFCTSLASVIIPDSVISIGDSAFAYCKSLTSVTIGNGVTSISHSAFSLCNSLTSVTIPNSVTSIGNSAFFNCTGLTSVTIPDSVTYIGNGAFFNCTNLTDVYYTGTEEMWNEISIMSSNDPLLNATIHFNYVSQPEVRDIQIRHTLDLASDISITFAVAKADLADYDSYYLEVVLPEYEGNELTGSSTVTIEPVISGYFYYFTLTGITAVRMGDMVEAVLHMTKDGTEYISNTDRYSVATYAYAMMNSTTDAKMLALCADLLRYGAEAQSFKKYRTDALVDTAMTDAQKAYLSNTDTLTFTATDSYLGDLANPAITWVGKTLDLGSKVGMKFVFNAKNYSGDIANLSMKVSYQGTNGETKSVTLTGAEVYSAANSYYSFTFYGLLASELRTVVDVAIYEGGTQLSETLCYSAESYASKTGGTELEALSKAIFAYSDSAKTFFAK